ncbi:cyclin-like protein [Nitzschia inconspicua]|uniref:Cyclin-like protein n=1 Tax=Nitzschia inconspicua TaxID=303405 RepID=A0A9K3KLD4_9STRA|nr:cyclin-like protein [Nitzschia inconspicua]
MKPKQSSFSCVLNDSADDCIVILKGLKQRENKYRVGDYLGRFAEQVSAPSKSQVDVQCRYQMCQWSYSIADYCKLKKDTVASAINTLDRFLDATPCALTDQSVFQLAAMTSMYMSVKLNEVNGLGMDCMVAFSRGSFSARQYETMEKIIVEACKWYMNPPTANQIGHELVLWMCGQDNIIPFDTLLDLVNLQVEAAVYDYYLVTAAPSLIAVAAFLNAVEGMEVHTPQEQRRIRNKVISAIEMSRSESQLLPKAQQRLYELISDSFTFSFDHPYENQN